MNRTAQQQGFTLLELMVSITLGLLIVAAASQLFISGQVSLSMQNSTADILDNGNFGLNYLTDDIRKANLGADAPVSDDTTLYGGIVLSANNVTPWVAIDPTLLTRGNGQSVGTGNAWTGLSNVTNDIKSDQLTIQYRPMQSVMTREELYKETANDADAAALKTKYSAIIIGTDCTGKNISLFEVRQQVHIVQRYFLRKDDAPATNEPNDALALACAASRYTEDDVNTQKGIDQLHKKDASNPAFVPIVLTGLDGKGQIIMNRIDHFHLILGVAAGTFDTPTDLRYMTVKSYGDLVGAKPRVRSVQIGMVVRATDSVGNDGLVANAPAFTLLDQAITLKEPTAGVPKYLRKVVTQTIALRNGLGVL